MTRAARPLIVACVFVGLGAASSWAAPKALSLPVTSLADISAIREAFSASTACPWGFVHNGIDFMPNPPVGSTVAYVAAVDGKVAAVTPRQNNITGNWQVNVDIDVQGGDSGPGAELGLTYVFETFSQAEADRDRQVSLLAVAPGRHLKRGDLVGRLWAANSGAHVHFGVLSGSPPAAVCPRPYFEAPARVAIVSKLDETWPGAAICYP